MSAFFRKLFAPWSARPLFGSDEAFRAFAKKRCRTLCAVRGALLLPAFAGLLLGYARDDNRLYYITAAALALVLALTLAVGELEKQLPKEDRA